jgi:hypothetical protein
VAENIFTNFVNIVAGTEIDFPVVLPRRQLDRLKVGGACCRQPDCLHVAERVAEAVLTKPSSSSSLHQAWFTKP